MTGVQTCALPIFKVGVAEWTRANCRTSSGEACTLCSERCPKDAISLVKDEGGEVAHPKVDAAKCVGCGICERGCKAGAIDAKAKAVDNGLCVRCFDCLGACGKGAIGL